jgi:carbon starvation protein CstA
LKRNPAYALYPMLFMYVTTLAATLITARNLYVTIIQAGKSGIAAGGAWAMIIIAILLFVTAIVIAWDGYKAYQRYSRGETAKPAPAPASD